MDPPSWKPLLETILEKATDTYNCLCHTKKWNMAMKEGGKRFNYSPGGSRDGGAGSSNLKSYNCGRKGCIVKKCDKPLNK